jgi:hypothetical protein
MFSRAQQPSSSSGARPEQDLQKDLEDLFADNLVSAGRVSRLLEKKTKLELTTSPRMCDGLLGKTMPGISRDTS